MPSLHPTGRNNTVVPGRNHKVKLRSAIQLATRNVCTMRTDGKTEILQGKMKCLGVSGLGICKTR